MEITPGSESLAQVQRHPSKNQFDFRRFHFPQFNHNHPPVVNVNAVIDEKLTVGQKVADMVAATMGSWRFIIIQSVLLTAWILLNIFGPAKWDIYPFILLNLALSFQAAYAAPFIMISQNRQAEKDRLTAQNDYDTDCKGEQEIGHKHLRMRDFCDQEIGHIMEHLDHQDELILQIVKRLEDQHQVMLGHLARLDPELAQKLGIEMKQVSAPPVVEPERSENA